MVCMYNGPRLTDSLKMAKNYELFNYSIFQHLIWILARSEKYVDLKYIRTIRIFSNSLSNFMNQST